MHKTYLDVFEISSSSHTLGIIWCQYSSRLYWDQASWYHSISHPYGCKYCTWPCISWYWQSSSSYIVHLSIWKLEPKFGYFMVQYRRHSSVIIVPNVGRLLGSLSSAGRVHLVKPCAGRTCLCCSCQCNRWLTGVEIWYHWCLWIRGYEMTHSRSLLQNLKLTFFLG